MTMTIKRMCEEIAAEITQRGGPVIAAKDIYAYSPSGELSLIFLLYWSLFPDRIPTDVPNPYVGDIRRIDDRLEAWDGREWSTL